MRVAAPWMRSMMSSRDDASARMSSRSIGVMKVVFSFLTTSWVIVSPLCSISSISRAFSLTLSKVSRRLFRSSAPSRMFWEAFSNRTKNSWSLGMMRNMERLLEGCGKKPGKRSSRLPLKRNRRDDRTSVRQLRQLPLRGENQVLDDLAHGLDLLDEGDALARHQRTALDVPVHHGAAKGADPELLEPDLGLLAGELPGLDLVQELELEAVEVLGSLVQDGAHGNGRKRRVELRGGHGVPGLRPDERLLESGVRNALLRHDEPRPQLGPCRAEHEVLSDHLPRADPPGHEDGNLRDA